MTNALVYLNPGLPIRIENVDRLVYLPDGSQHVLDEHDRPLFTAPAGAGVCIIMEYSKNEDPSEAQVAPFAREQHAQKMLERRRAEAAVEMTQPIKQVPPEEEIVNVNRRTGAVSPITPIVPLHLHGKNREPFPPVKEFGTQPVVQPGEVRVRTAAEVPSDVTGEMAMPDFQEAPKGAAGEQGESSSPKETETSEPSAAAS